MTKPKELKQVYRRGPSHKDYLRAHNRVSQSGSGFRCFWIPPEWTKTEWSLCPCSWGGEPHYALTEQVKAKLEVRP
jgi:hypothetical protein